MTSRTLTLLITAWTGVSGLCTMRAGEPDDGLPKAVDAGITGNLLKNPPFTRAVNLAESLTLTGVAYVEGKAVATVKDSTTKQSYVVTQEPNALGWKLAEVVPSSQLQRAEVRIMVGGEVVAIHYSTNQLPPGHKPGVYLPSHIPTEQELTGHDDKGAYVRGMVYLTDEDRESFRNVPREVREKFLNIVHDQRDMLFKASHEERAAFAKQAYDTVMKKR